MGHANLQPAPTTWWGWVELICSWLLVNVVWALIPLIVTLFFALAVGMTPNFGNELRVGFTVLALGLCGTQFVDDVQIPIRHLLLWKWLKNLSIIIVVFGALASALNILNGIADPKIKVDIALLDAAVVIVVIGAVALSFAAFLVKTLAASETFEHVIDGRKNALIAAAEANTKVNGIQL